MASDGAKAVSIMNQLTLRNINFDLASTSHPPASDMEVGYLDHQNFLNDFMLRLWLL